jgi:hypothetical protein
MNTIMMDPGMVDVGGMNPEIVAEMIMAREAPACRALARPSSAFLLPERDFPYNREFHLRLT